MHKLRVRNVGVKEGSKLQALVYDVLPSTTAVFSLEEGAGKRCSECARRVVLSVIWRSQHSSCVDSDLVRKLLQILFARVRCHFC